jgi:hypothetical protein
MENKSLIKRSCAEMKTLKTMEYNLFRNLSDDLSALKSVLSMLLKKRHEIRDNPLINKFIEEVRYLSSRKNDFFKP